MQQQEFDKEIMRVYRKSFTEDCTHVHVLVLLWLLLMVCKLIYINGNKNVLHLVKNSYFSLDYISGGCSHILWAVR